LKRDELSSLVERLENGTLRLGDLALSGEGGFGFQHDVRAAVSGRARRAAKGGEDLLERGTSAGRDLLDRAKGEDLLERSTAAGRELLDRAKGAVGR
jgi:hypothetical protein